MSEIKVTIPSCKTIIFMQTGEDNLTAEDYAYGYEFYIDYDVIEGVNKGDGGIYMISGTDEKNWLSRVPDVIKFILDVDECPGYGISEVAA